MQGERTGRSGVTHNAACATQTQRPQQPEKKQPTTAAFTDRRRETDRRPHKSSSGSPQRSVAGGRCAEAASSVGAEKWADARRVESVRDVPPCGAEGGRLGAELVGGDLERGTTAPHNTAQHITSGDFRAIAPTARSTTPLAPARPAQPSPVCRARGPCSAWKARGGRKRRVAARARLGGGVGHGGEDVLDCPEHVGAAGVHRGCGWGCVGAGAGTGAGAGVGGRGGGSGQALLHRHGLRAHKAHGARGRISLGSTKCSAPHPQPAHAPVRLTHAMRSLSSISSDLASTHRDSLRQRRRRRGALSAQRSTSPQRNRSRSSGWGWGRRLRGEGECAAAAHCSTAASSSCWLSSNRFWLILFWSELRTHKEGTPVPSAERSVRAPQQPETAHALAQAPVANSRRGAGEQAPKKGSAEAQRSGWRSAADEDRGR